MKPSDEAFAAGTLNYFFIVQHRKTIFMYISHETMLLKIFVDVLHAK